MLYVTFDIVMVSATLNQWVRRLIGKPGVPYNRSLRVRTSSHPLIYGDGLSITAAKSKAFRNQSGLSVPERRIAALISFASGGVTLSQSPKQTTIANVNNLESSFGSSLDVL